MKSFVILKKHLLKDAEISRAYASMGPEFDLARVIIEKRIQKGLTQAELARKTRTKQSAISRLESGHYNPSLAFLGKISKALGARVVVSLM